MDLKEAQSKVDAWIGQFEEGYWPPMHNLARLMEEVGELARELNHLYGSKPKRPEEHEQELAMELADVLFVLLVIANEQKIDLDGALVRVLEKYRARTATGGPGRMKLEERRGFPHPSSSTVFHKT